MTLYYYYTMDPSLKQKLAAYEKTLSEQEKKAMEIAKRLLKTTFDLKKSNAFLKWSSS